MFYAHVGTLINAPRSWQPVKLLDWLAKHDNSEARFTPQPYMQPANKLRQNGFPKEVARVLIRREDKQRAAERKPTISSMDGFFAEIRLALHNCSTFLRA